MAVPDKVDVGGEFTEFPGGSFNALVDGYWRQRGQRNEVQPTTKPDLPRVVVRVKNASGADRFKGHVLGIDGALFSCDDNPGQVWHGGPALKGIVPTATHDDAFVVTLETIATGAIGRAFILGCDWARVKVNMAADEFATVEADEADYLRSGSSGARILYKEKQHLEGSEALGVQWALVLLGGGGGGEANSALRFGYVAAEISGATGPLPEDWGVGTVQFYNDDGEADGSPEEVRNRYYSNIPEDAPGYCSLFTVLGEQVWIAINFDCRTEP